MYNKFIQCINFYQSFYSNYINLVQASPQMSSNKQKTKSSVKLYRFSGPIQNSAEINSEYYETTYTSTSIAKKIKEAKEKAKLRAKVNNGHERALHWRRPTSIDRQRSFSNQGEDYKRILEANSIKSPVLQKSPTRKFGLVRYQTEPIESSPKLQVHKLHEDESAMESRYRDFLRQNNLNSLKKDNIIRQPTPLGKSPTFACRGTTYYISNIIRNYKNKESACHRHIQNNLDYVKLFEKGREKPLYEKELSRKKLQLEQKDKYSKRKTVIFDLDETLIHSSDSLREPYGVKCLVKADSYSSLFHVIVRPYATQLLENLASKFELMLFTASQPAYADEVLKILDPQGQLFQHRLYRGSCIMHKDKFVKDLRVIDRNLEDVVLVDNAGYSYEMQKQNGIPILPFFGGKDAQLRALEQYLDTLAFAKDVRQKNKRMFKLHRYGDFESAQELIEKLYVCV